MISFLWLYLIGRYIGTHISLDSIRRWRWLWLAGYVAACMGLFVLIMLRYHCHLTVRYVYDYNHPLVLLAALMLLLFFLSFSFQSKGINWLASSVFAAYLFQESTYLGHQYIYPQMEAFFHHHVPQALNVAVLFAVSMAFVATSILADKLLGLLSMPLLNLYDRVACTYNRK